MSALREANYLAGALRRRLRPSPEERARRALEAEAARVGRGVGGTIRLMDLDIAYADAVSTVPQWDDLFVRRSLAFTPSTSTPRILDCGANIGLSTLWLRRAFPGARITAFEPDPTVAALLARNLRENGAADVEVVRAAVWSAAGSLRFHADGADSGAVAVVAGLDPGGTATEVPAVRLRDWLDAGPVDLLKLDVEGAELELLRDAGPALGRIGALHMEVHDFAVADRRLPACLDLLQRAGLAYTLDGLHQATWRADAPPAGPFPGVGAWVVHVRAWPLGTPS